MRAHLFLQKHETDFQHQFFKNNSYMPYIEKKKKNKPHGYSLLMTNEYLAFSLLQKGVT